MLAESFGQIWKLHKIKGFTDLESDISYNAYYVWKFVGDWGTILIIEILLINSIDYIARKQYRIRSQKFIRQFNLEEL